MNKLYSKLKTELTPIQRYEDMIKEFSLENFEENIKLNEISLYALMKSLYNEANFKLSDCKLIKILYMINFIRGVLNQ